MAERVTHRVRTLEELGGAGLKAGFLFDLPASQADRLLGESIRLDVPSGSVIYREGEAARCFIVVHGIVRAYVSSRDGRQVTFRYGKVGDVMGLASVIGELPPLTIQAMTAASVVAIRVDSLRAMVATDPVVARVCAEELTRQLYRALGGVAQSSFDSVRQRVARQLLDLAVEAADGGLVAEATHQELADAIGSSRVVVTRTLQEMRANGLIESRHDRAIMLLDVHGLARIMDAEEGPEPLRASGPSS